ncbi:antitoxin family protein [Anatilimnocola floriformis]|uniref:antitoxin family protein n=1 Tax=Anatilimnocola floriformis TaxID=2948575 RepID=UPI0020C5830A|nr:antitoxin family protein [Anatilimnocola floriformis]
MTQTFLATYEDGVLKPHEPLRLLPQSQVRVVIESVDTPTDEERAQAWESVQRLWKESPIDSGGDRLTRDQLHERR